MGCAPVSANCCTASPPTRTCCASSSGRSSRGAVPPAAVIASDNSAQVDHILPWSRFGDDSFLNKTLCTARANQRKKGRTPLEWFQAEKTQAEWERFVGSVEGLKSMKGRKKRNYLLNDAEAREESFKNGNLGDTRYAARVVTEILKLLYPEEKQGSEGGGERRVVARPGPLTARLRQGWGIEAHDHTTGNRQGNHGVGDARRVPRQTLPRGNR